jgi:hypothetical protein
MTSMNDITVSSWSQISASDPFALLFYSILLGFDVFSFDSKWQLKPKWR